MAVLINDEDSLAFEISLIDLAESNDYTSKTLTWIKYSLCLKSGDEVIEYLNNKDISLETMDYFLKGIERIIQVKKNAEELLETFEVNPLDNSFYMKIDERGVEDLVCIEIWFNIAILTSGKIIGFKKGIQFDANIKALCEFYSNLTKDYKGIFARSRCLSP